jgi:hypothetical protein
MKNILSNALATHLEEVDNEIHIRIDIFFLHVHECL